MQEESEKSEPHANDVSPSKGTRIMNAPVDDFDPTKPRLGRRESESHSAEVSYLYDILSSNFPADRTMWDLHHYFQLEGEEVDLQFDISYFKGFTLPYAISSYHASEYQNRVPTLAINVLSKSTWRADLSDTLEYCRLLRIPLYLVFSPYDFGARAFKPPFARCYILQEDGMYKQQETRKIALKEGGELDPTAILDISEILPFRIGLRERLLRFKLDLPLYRVVAIASTEDRLYLSNAEQAKAQAEEYKIELDKYRKKLGHL